MNLDGYYLDIHAPDESQLVKPREELLGQRIHDTHPPKNVEMFEASVKELGRTGEIQFAHYSLKVQSGLEHFERRMVRSGPNEVLMIITNVSQRVEQQKQLEEQSQRRTALLNANPDLVFRMNFDGTILEVHTSDPDLLIEKTEISTTEGNNMKDLVPPWLFSKWVESRDAYLKTGKTQSYEYELKVRKGIIFFEARVTGCGESEFYVVIRDISSRKKAEQKLIASEERYRTLVESLPDITIRTDFEGYYLDHHIAENLFIAENIRDKFSNQKQLGKQIWSVFDQKLQKSLLRRWRKIRDRSYQNQTVKTFEYRLPGENAEVFWSMRVKALPNQEVVMHIRDVSERRKMIQEIQNNEKRFRQMVEKLPVPVSITRLDNHEILYVNPKGYEIYGMDPKASGFTGKKALDYYKDAEERLKLVDEIKNQGFVEPMEREFFRPDGTRFWGMQSSIKIEFEGFEASLTTFVDTTELRQARGQLIEKSRLAGLGHLSAGLAHELNTPLASMTLILENLNEALPENLVQEFPKSTDLIQGQLNRISEIVKQMLEFGREPIKKRITIFDLRTVVQSVLILAEGTFKQQKIRFSKKLHRSPVRVRASRWQMEHVLHNLLNNACYALRGMPDPEIQLSLEKRDGQAFLEVRDNGCGIAEHDLPKLKDPFFTTKPPGEGTGLGLSVCHGYLEEHGGELDISSPGPGKGASFQIWLPLEKTPSRSVSSNKSPAN
ncbi:MAG: ATP-binding protein, partial [bacterium]